MHKREGVKARHGQVHSAEMNCQRFYLFPFPSKDLLPEFRVACAIAAQPDSLSIRYEIVGDISGISIPGQADSPSRKKDLWKDTCFEVFLGVRGASDYWEFNLSPSGHWNVFHFEAYRQGEQEEAAYMSMPITVQRGADSVVVEAEFNLSLITQQEQHLDAAFCAVIRKRDGEMTYWALTHQGPKADFHRRDSFIIELF